MGTVMDSATHSPLQNVSVCARNTNRCVLTNVDGKFRIGIDKNVRRLTFTNTGYHPSSLPLTDDPEQHLTVFLSESYTTLQGVLVNGKRKRYKNKNNPAVDLIRQVIANKSKNGPGAYPFLSYQQYEKIQLLVDKKVDRLTQNKLLKKFDFVFQNADTSMIPGKALSSVYMQEILSQIYYRRHPENKKQIILGRKSVDYGEYVDMKGISTILSRLYEDINIYDNSVSIFTIQFVSPVADLAPTFYMYYIRDTVVENGVKLVKLAFQPRNPEDLLFRGTLYITLDGNYAIQRAELGVSKNTNLNWIRQFSVKQDFEKAPGERYHLAKSDILAYFSPLSRSPGIFGERTVIVSQVKDSPLPDVAFSGKALDSLPQASHQPASFWSENRPEPLRESEEKTYTNTDSLLKMRPYRRLMDYANLVTAGYKSAGKFDIGPVGNFYSFNDLEGQRLRVGGRSNTKLSTRYYGESYVAYGFKDERWKYFLSGTYAFNNKSIYTFPFHFIQASFFHDTRNPGEENVFAQGNSFLSSFNRGVNSKWLYNDIFRLTYVHEADNHFSQFLGFKYWRQQPADSLYYIYQPGGEPADTVKQVVTTELSATFRWAPHEQFYQGKTSRSNIINKYPIITFQYARGINGLFGGQYSYNAFHLNVYKRFYLSPLGFSDVTLDAGYLDGNLPFPLLIIHPGNQSYYYTQNAYNLMNIEEFVSDHYAGVNIDHYFNGFFFNKIPLLKKLKLREVIAGKLLYGGVRDENNPAKNPDQMKFPLTNGVLATYVLNNQPYFEASAGIYNIFRIWRLDLVKRFTYLQHPGISTLGLRVSGTISF